MIVAETNHSMQRMGASRSGQWQFARLRRLAPTADAGRWTGARLMKPPFPKRSIFGLAFLMYAVAVSSAQGVFTFDLAGEYSPRGPVDTHCGSGSITMDDSTGQFLVDIAAPFDTDSFTPVISTPSGTLTFSLGTGSPATFPIWPSGNLVSGVQYTGSFQSSSAAYSDLLLGVGQFQLTATSGSGAYLWGAISAVPEPTSASLAVCGLLLWLLVNRWARQSGTKSNLSMQRIGASHSARTVFVAQWRLAPSADGGR